MTTLGLVVAYLVSWVVSYTCLVDALRSDFDYTTKDRPFVVFISTMSAVLAGVPAVIIWLLDGAHRPKLHRGPERIIKPRIKRED